jgi:hypothetical protein
MRKPSPLAGEGRERENFKSSNKAQIHNAVHCDLGTVDDPYPAKRGVTPDSDPVSRLDSLNYI